MSAGGGKGKGGIGLPFFHALHGALGKLQKTHGVGPSSSTVQVLFIAANIFFFMVEPGQSARNYELLIFLSPLWLPVLLGKNAWARWMDYRQFDYNTSQEHTLLELRIPREMLKTPLAMETILSNIHINPGQGTWYKKYILGRTRPWWSLELAALNGRVHFFIRVRTPLRHYIETYFYAQYPGIEVIEATDYTRLVDPSQPPYKMCAYEYMKKKPDPYPIRTYVDFGLDKMPVAEPEEATDPLGQIIEFLGSFSPHEQVWLHIMIRFTKGEKQNKKNAQGKPYTWRDEAKEIIADIKESTVKKTIYTDPFTGEPRESDGFPNPSKGDSETMATIERNVGKPGFDVGIRAIYFAKTEHYRDFIGAFLSQIFRPYLSEQLNQLGPAPVLTEIFDDFPWEDPKGTLRQHLMEEAVEFARRRAYFHYPYRGSWMVMSTEEIASLYHVPSSTITTPSLPRIQSTTTEAPANLPI